METIRTIGGYYQNHEYAVIDVHGRDAARFLQAQTTNDINALADGAHQQTSLVDRRGKLVALFSLYKLPNSFRIFAPKTEAESILAHLDSFRIADKVEFEDVSNSGHFLVLQGPKTRQVLASAITDVFDPTTFVMDYAQLTLLGHATEIYRYSMTGEDGYAVAVRPNDGTFESALIEACEFAGFTRLETAQIETARVEAGIPKFGVDILKDDFLPETGLDQSIVSYTKGCFLGQEVLARVKHLGAPTRGLMGIRFASGLSRTYAFDTPVLVNGEEIASLKSNAYSEQLQRTVSLASVKREYRVPGKTFDATINGAPCKIEIVTLPFVMAKPIEVLARPLYERALLLYAKEDDNQAQSTAVTLLKEALALDPRFEDAYEALGVILSKRQQLDEAISLMKQLAALNKDSVMAHTNLSVFYLEKGMKEEAEEEKAISVSIRMLQAARGAAQRPAEDDAKQKMQEETKQRMEMFKQVLEIDADDLLANYGMGSCHVALGNFATAVPFLTKAIEIKASHTVAYVSLAEAYEKLGKIDDAVATYEKGIEVAAKRGDMTPMNDMQQRLAKLQSTLTKQI